MAENFDDDVAPEPPASFKTARPVPCAHPNIRPCRRVIDGGSVTIYRQCPDCGYVESNAIKRTKFTAEEFAALPEFSESRRDALRDQQQGEAQAERQAKYHAYLCSDEWKEKRLLVFKRDGYLCQGCRNAQATDCHHLTYDHLYHEPLFELVAVCARCHKEIHHLPWEDSI